MALPLIMLGAMMFEQRPEIGSGFVTVGVVIIVVGALIISTLGSILRAALYIYAVEGEMPINFDARLIRNAFLSDKK